MEVNVGKLQPMGYLKEQENSPYEVSVSLSNITERVLRVLISCIKTSVLASVRLRLE